MGVANQARIWLDNPLLSVDTKNPTPVRAGVGISSRAIGSHVFWRRSPGITASFPSSGVPQLTVTAQDKRLSDETRPKSRLASRASTWPG